MEAAKAQRNGCRPQDDSPDEEINIQLKVIETLCLRVKKSDKVRNVKSLIREIVSVSEDYQELLFSGNLLKDGQRLLDYGLDDNSAVHLFVRELVKFKVLIKLPSPHERIVPLEVNTGNTVQTIKEQVQEKEGINPDSFFLVHSSLRLEEDKTLVSLDIKKNSILDLILSTKELSIAIKMPEGKIVNLKIRSTTTICEMKMILRSMTYVRVTDPSLFYVGQHLEDYETLASYNIGQGSVLELGLSLYQIFVKTIYGKTATLDVHSSLNVLELREKIHRSLDILVDLQSLFFDGKHVGDDGTLGCRNIKRDSVIFVRTQFKPQSNAWNLRRA